MPRYRFSEFTLSPRRRLLLRAGREQPLIPRYFDLLVYLVERRHEAVHRRDIFDHIWSDVIVSDSALTQAIRTIRRTLGDDPREPRFIRTVSRHGYRFVCGDLVEDDDDGPWAEAAVEVSPASAAHGDAVHVVTLHEPLVSEPADDPFELLLERLTASTLDTQASEEDRREAAELLHGLGTAETLRRLGVRPGHQRARALLRDTRWDVEGAGHVPLLGQPGAAGAVMALVRLRVRRAARAVAVRWASASIGAGVAGLCGGLAGGAVLAVAPGATASPAVIPVLALIGFGCGAAGGAGVGAGLEVAEAVVRSRRAVALVCGGALGGAAIGVLVQWVSRAALAILVDVHLDAGGGLEGLVLGGAAGLGYASGTSSNGTGLAAPRGRRRLVTAGTTALACACAALVLVLLGRPLVGGTLHLLAEVTGGGQTTLAPIGRLLGEPGFGEVTGTLIGMAEGALFGFGLALGLTRRTRVGAMAG